MICSEISNEETLKVAVEKFYKGLVEKSVIEKNLS
jgi:hypothetical protein